MKLKRQIGETGHDLQTDRKTRRPQSAKTLLLFTLALILLGSAPLAAGIIAFAMKTPATGDLTTLAAHLPTLLFATLALHFAAAALGAICLHYNDPEEI